MTTEELLQAIEREMVVTTARRAARHVRALQADVERIQRNSITPWECPDCGYTIDAAHAHSSPDAPDKADCAACCELQLREEVARLTAELAALRQRVSQPCGVPTEPGWKWLSRPASRIAFADRRPVEVLSVAGTMMANVCGSLVSLDELLGAEWATCPPPAGDKGG